jgi:hypothetical protein
MKTWLSCAGLALLLGACATAATAGPGRWSGVDLGPQDATKSQSQSQPQTQTQPAEEPEPEHSVGHVLLWYIPNRISDVLDIVRARLRVGPGLEVGARVTELVDFNLGGYASVFVGIPGPRRERVFNWPFGFDNMAGAEISVIDATTHSGDAPHYGVAEVGLGAQLAIVGFDLGVDVWEAVDFVTGIVCIDLEEDDL